MWAMTYRQWLAAAVLATSVVFLSGCAVIAVAGAATGLAVAVTGAVVGTGVTVAGKVVGAGISAVTPGSDSPAP